MARHLTSGATQALPWCFGTSAKWRARDCALGSCLEGAACLDLAWIKASLVFPRDAGRLSRRSGSGGLEGCPAGSDGLAYSIAPAGTVGMDQVHAITKVSDEPQGLPIPTVRDLANDKGLDEGGDEGPAAASENGQTPASPFHVAYAT